MKSEPRVVGRKPTPKGLLEGVAARPTMETKNKSQPNRHEAMRSADERR